MQWDIIFIGGGMASAGALRAASLGLRVAVVDRQAPGGTAVHAGCLPARTMWHGARLFQRVRSASEYGVLAPGTILNLDLLHRKRLALRDQAVSQLTDAFQQAGVTFFLGTGSLDGPGRVVISPEGEEARLENAAHVVVATGSRSQRPAELVPDGHAIITSDDLFELRQLPDHVGIIGGGAFGCEAASFFAALGCRVTLVEKEARLLPNLDRELGENLEERFRQVGMTVLTGTTPRGTRRTPEGVELMVAGASQGSLGVDLILLATGRTPNTSRLGLERLHVATDEVGCIEVDERYAASAKGLYAIGDVVGAPVLGSASARQACLLAEQIAGRSPSRSPSIDAQVLHVACHPPVATVGLSEDTAVAHHGAARVEVSRKGAGDGMLKLIRVGGKLVGAHASGAATADLPAWAVALQFEGGVGFDPSLLRTTGVEALAAEMNTALLLPGF